MNSKEFLDYFKETFEELQNNKSLHPIKRCKLCLLKAPAASTNSSVCEMCYEEGVELLQDQ